MTMRPAPRDTLIRNLRFLMDRAHWSERETARRAKVSQKTVNKILNGASSPQLDTVNAIAAAFGLEGWHLIMPDLPQDLIASPRLAKMVQGYLSAEPEARDIIDRMLERESSR